MVLKKIHSGFKKYNKITFFLILLLLFVFIFLYFNVFLFTLITFLSGLIQYYTMKFKIKYHIGHVLFLSIMITREIGVVAAIIFLLLSDIVPRIIISDLGFRIIILSLIKFLMILIFGYIKIDLLLVGFVFAFIYYLSAYLISKYMGETLPEIIMEIGLPFFMNIVYFTSLTNLVIKLLGYVVF